MSSGLFFFGWAVAQSRKPSPLSWCEIAALALLGGLVVLGLAANRLTLVQTLVSLGFFAVVLVIAWLWHRFCPEGQAQDDDIWGIVSKLRGVGYLSDYDPRSDPGVLRHLRASRRSGGRNPVAGGWWRRCERGRRHVNDGKGRAESRRHHRRTADYRGTGPGGASAGARGHGEGDEQDEGTARRQQKGERFLAHTGFPP